MLHIFEGLRDITSFSVIVRLLLACVCGAAIGLERSYKNRPAGFRTHILVCIGATVAAMTGVYLAINKQFPTDLSRLGAQVVSGLGFIGGGTIIVTGRKKIKGLTTASGLWATGIIGLSIGSGYYEGAIVAVILVLITEIFLSKLSSRIKRNPVFHIQITYQEKEALDHVLRHCKNNSFAINNLQVSGTYDSDAPLYTAIISLRSQKSNFIDPLIQQVEQIEGVLSAEMTDL